MTSLCKKSTSPPLLFAAPAKELEQAKMLKPWALLQRLRPAKIAAIVNMLDDCSYLCRALKLAKLHFPLEYENYNDLLAGDGIYWPDVLLNLIYLAKEGDYFEVDQLMVDGAWDTFLSEGDKSGLVRFLNELPITLFGFSGQNIFKYPPFELMRFLFLYVDENLGVVSPTLLNALALMPDRLLEQEWDDEDRLSAWKCLSLTIEAGPDHYPEPVRWLPQLVRWACGRTNNPILDLTWEPTEFIWDNLPEIRTAWQQAKPVIEQGNRLMKWYEQDKLQNLAYLAYFLMEATHCDYLNW